MCSHCHMRSPASGFNNSAKSKDGLQSWCRACQIKYERTRRKRTQKVTYKKKTCTRCGKKKWLSEFTRLTRSKDGRSCECRECSRARSRKNRKERPAIIGTEPNPPAVPRPGTGALQAHVIQTVPIERISLDATETGYNISATNEKMEELCAADEVSSELLDALRKELKRIANGTLWDVQ